MTMHFGAGKNARIYRDMHEGDSPERFHERMIAWEQDESRRASTAGMVRLLFDQLGTMSREEAGRHRSTSGLPSMIVRTIGNKLFGTANTQHCHAGIYRSRGAMTAMENGGLDHKAYAVVHCEHTIPSSMVVDQLWMLRSSGALKSPRQMLQWIFDHTLVTVFLQSEGTDSGAVALNRVRTIGGRSGKWASSHPDVGGDQTITDETRPLLRYVGTGADIYAWPSRDLIDIETYTIADHRAHIAHNPVFQADRYFEASEDEQETAAMIAQVEDQIAANVQRDPESREYVVVWKIDVVAISAEDAARQARAIQLKTDSIADSFEVTAHSASPEETKTVDLSEIDGRDLD